MLYLSQDKQNQGLLAQILQVATPEELQELFEALFTRENKEETFVFLIKHAFMNLCRPENHKCLEPLGQNKWSELLDLTKQLPKDNVRSRLKSIALEQQSWVLLSVLEGISMPEQANPAKPLDFAEFERASVAQLLLNHVNNNNFQNFKNYYQKWLEAGKKTFIRRGCKANNVSPYKIYVK